MPPIFYQRYWSVMDNDVVSLCLEVQNGNGNIAAIDHTFIALISKLQVQRM